MREVKFRSWHNTTINGDFVMSPHEQIVKNCGAYLCDNDKFPNGIIMQFTGLQDKNGVDIYEGDIVKGVHNQHYWLSVISVDNGKMGNTNLYAMEFCNNVTTCEFEEVYTFERQNSTRRNDINTSMEVIGNIHENPELLKEVNNEN